MSLIDPAEAVDRARWRIVRHGKSDHDALTLIVQCCDAAIMVLADDAGSAVNWLSDVRAEAQRELRHLSEQPPAQTGGKPDDARTKGR